MRIERLEALSKNPAAVLLAMEGHLDLLKRGWTDESSCGLGWSEKAVVGYEEDVVVGVIIFEEQDWKSAFAIHLGYVRSGHRGAGIYRALWAEVCQWAGEKGARRITGATHHQNDVMRVVMKRLGRQLTWVGYEYRLPEEEKPCAS